MQHTLSRPDGRHGFDLDSKGTDLIVEKKQSNIHAKPFSKFFGRKSPAPRSRVHLKEHKVSVISVIQEDVSVCDPPSSDSRRGLKLIALFVHGRIGRHGICSYVAGTNSRKRGRNSSSASLICHSSLPPHRASAWSLLLITMLAHARQDGQCGSPSTAELDT